MENEIYVIDGGSFLHFPFPSLSPNVITFKANNRTQDKYNLLVDLVSFAMDYII